jgi:DNA-binding beta-propeller fold protein YncE
VSNEADTTLDVVDGRTLRVTSRIPLSGHPNNVAASRDGARVYVAIRQAPGAVDVVDTASLQRVKSIPVKGEVHNTYVTPDGRFVIAGSIAGKNITVIDQQTEQPVWTSISISVRPMAFEQNADLDPPVHQLTDVNEIRRLATHREVTRVTRPPDRAGKPVYEGNTSHGMAVTADNRRLVVNSRLNSAVYVLLAAGSDACRGRGCGRGARWVTLTPDGRTAYVAQRLQFRVGGGYRGMREVTRIPVGQVPKRNITRCCPKPSVRLRRGQPALASSADPEPPERPCIWLRHALSREP